MMIKELIEFLKVTIILIKYKFKEISTLIISNQIFKIKIQKRNFEKSLLVINIK